MHTQREDKHPSILLLPLPAPTKNRSIEETTAGNTREEEKSKLIPQPIPLSPFLFALLVLCFVGAPRRGRCAFTLYPLSFSSSSSSPPPLPLYRVVSSSSISSSRPRLGTHVQTAAVVGSWLLFRTPFSSFFSSSPLFKNVLFIHPGISYTHVETAGGWFVFASFVYWSNEQFSHTHSSSSLSRS